MANRPIIIKRKKVIEGGHHGGAWKVAYADFVTAMMAFFMLMWLLNATSEQQRAGLADYFTPTASINRTSGGGQGMFGGESIFADDQLVKNGQGASFKHEGAQVNSAAEPDDAKANGEEIAKVKALENLEEVLLGRGGESTLSNEALRHIITRQTDEGLVIELFDREGAALFVDDTATPHPIAVEIGKVLAAYLAIVENPLALQAHVRAQPIVRRDNTVWQLSMDRANTMRELIEAGGYAPEDIARVTGKADRQPVVDDRTAIRNNRIEVIVLRSDL
jgi:chemotaxis protein MotB